MAYRADFAVTPNKLATLEALRAAGRLTEAERVEVLRLNAAWREPIPQVLAGHYGIPNAEWANTMARSCRMEFADLRAFPPEAELVRDGDREDYLRLGFMPWRIDPAGNVVIAAREPEDPEVREWVEAHFPGRPARYVVTGKFDIIWSLQTLFEDEMSYAAREALHTLTPELSAKTTFSRGQKNAFLIILIAILLGFTASVRGAIVAISAVISVLYMVLFLFRALLTFVGSGRHVDLSVSRAQVEALAESDLPVFTILVPMYREAEVLPMLVSAIRNLDYPRAKLDVKLVLEADDQETIEAARALGAEDVFEIIRVPASQPKTKPKACNFALHFARGEYTVVFDAEDTPEPDQLKKVVALFRASPDNVACVQARLNYFNRDDNFLTRMFTLEYSHWFDYLLPGLHLLHIPIPLGGTSNHLKTEVLIGLGAWDPYNVTEDADLGVRLTQAGYRVAVVNSTTYEEANGVLSSWINQRSRWIKGYMQTWLVHMRHPIELYRRLGPVGFIGFQLFIGFPPLSVLINPLLWFIFFASLLGGPDRLKELFPPGVLAIALFDLLISNGMYIYFNVVAASKRQWYELAPWGLLAPIYWVLHSVAAYKALGQLISNPHYWEKTEHGTSAQTRDRMAAIVSSGASPPSSLTPGPA